MHYVNDKGGLKLNTDNMEEIWEDVVGYEGLYKVSNLGRVLSLGRTSISKDGRKFTSHSRMLNIIPRKARYIKVTLVNLDGKCTTTTVHRLVALAFVPNPENKPQVNHLDGLRTNNRVDNLVWVTHSENNLHAYSTGLLKPVKGEKHGSAKLTESDVLTICHLLDTTSMTRKEIGIKYSVSGGAITDIHLGLRWSHLTGRSEKVKPKTMAEINSKRVMNNKGEIFKSVKQATEHYGLKSSTSISNACIGKQKTAAGIEWHYTSEVD